MTSQVDKLIDKIYEIVAENEDGRRRCDDVTSVIDQYKEALERQGSTGNEGE